jgi:hypothetical protein
VVVFSNSISDSYTHGKDDELDQKTSHVVKAAECSVKKKKGGVMSRILANESTASNYGLYVTGTAKVALPAHEAASCCELPLVLSMLPSACRGNEGNTGQRSGFADIADRIMREGCFPCAIKSVNAPVSGGFNHRQHPQSWLVGALVMLACLLQPCLGVEVSAWRIESGGEYCQVDGACVTDGAGDYGGGRVLHVRAERRGRRH